MERKDGTRGARGHRVRRESTGNRPGPTVDKFGPRPQSRGARSKPDLPSDRPHLPREVFSDIKASSGGGDVDDIARAVAGAESALEQGDHEGAIAYLEWAKSAAARSWAVREGLGIAYYLAGRYRDAHRELLTYRRLSGRQDQNHLLADCARAEGDFSKMRGYVDAMVEAGVDDDVVVEGVIVLAGARQDREDLLGAVRELQRITPRRDQVSVAHVRMWYLEADLLRQLGKSEESDAVRQKIRQVDPGFLEEMEG